ncbi:ribosome biogenesis GTPase YlqF [Lactobacillus psittaci]|uniref:Ribosome biogenesis GTPase A n=1 Tax=Lactobacillus psittaci DSM 15354 TaxID=1122152 RepID=A0A0R1S3D8_9LACO|nr:ribosome biogenesis GTPase YlqF [Lactobacillus psittaci]KRL63584.1 ribosome biogenesis GTP-binding protein YlqF [Lactobacillus psittaci DSM 15354]
MAIQWYPGHMNKARNQLEDKLNLLDVIVEVVDARIPVSSRNPLISDLVGSKPHIIILNKSDLADPQEVKKWSEYLASEGKFVISLDAQHKTNMDKLFNLIKEAAREKTKKLEAKGASNPTIRISLVGIPNCGKSTIINRLVGRNVAIVGDRPGVTKGQTWLKTSQNVQILDTPGILWPKFEDQKVGYRLAALGAIKESVFHADDVALFVMDYLRQNYLKNLVEFSRLPEADVVNLPLPELLLEMTKKYGMRDDYDRMSMFLLNQLRKGRLGKINLEKVDA